MGLNKYIILLDNKYFKNFEEIDKKYGQQGHTLNLNNYYVEDKIITTSSKLQAYIIEGQTNIMSYVDKILNKHYKEFKTLSIIKLES